MGRNATPRQRALAEELGIALPPNADTYQARKLIDEAPVPQWLLEQAEELRVPVAADATYGVVMHAVMPVRHEASIKLLAESGWTPGEIILKWKDQLWLVTNTFPDEGKVTVKPMTPFELVGTEVTATVDKKDRHRVVQMFTLRRAKVVDVSRLGL
jgi:hypothetical protein